MSCLIDKTRRECLAKRFSIGASLSLALTSMLSSAEAGVVITTSSGPPSGSQVLISSPSQDSSGTTSLRFLHPRDGANQPDQDAPENYLYDGPFSKPRVWYYRRDRDLGQTFTVGANPILIDALTLRIGPSASAVQPEAPGAEVFIQIYEVSGSPALDDHGTAGPDASGDGRYTRWRTFDPTDWRTDDHLVGETFTIVNTVRGTLPTTLAANDFLKFDLTGNDELVLAANTAYAWMIGFAEPSAPGGDRALSLANEYFGSYPGGHGLRRGGSTLDLESTFIRDQSDAIDRAESASAATFPTVLSTRQAIPPGTHGFPDVEAYRDYRFYVEGRIVPGTPYCFGDPGSGTPCPCNNDNDRSAAGSGCANGAFASGARLVGSGLASVTNDTLVLCTTSQEPRNSGLYFQGTTKLTGGVIWGDGLRCSGGGVERIQVRFSDASGSSSTTIPIASQGGVSAGNTRYYQCWYRNPLNSPCGHQFNTSNGYAVTWAP